MTVRIRMETSDVDELDAHEAALRSVLTIPELGPVDYTNRADTGRRRYLVSSGVRTPAAAADGAGELSPLATAEAAKRRRDIGGEVGALLAGADALARQPWAPLRLGDVVLCYLPGDGGQVPDYGQTYVAVEDLDVDGHAMVREISRTDEEMAEVELGSFYELWFEAGASALTVIRAGAVVHGRPAAAAPAAAATGA